MLKEGGDDGRRCHTCITNYESISSVVLARSATLGLMWESNSAPC